MTSLVYFSALMVVALLPPSLAYPLAAAFGRLLCAIDVVHRNARIDAVVSRVGLSRSEAARQVRRSFELMVCDDLECWLIPRLDRRGLERLIRFEGLEHLDAALALGKGAVLCSGHTWGSRLGMAGLAMLGYRLVLARGWLHAGPSMSHRRWLAERYRRNIEKRLNVRFLTPGEREDSLAVGPLCVSALRKNEIVAFKPDVLFRSSGSGDVTLPFLNGTETFRPGGVLIARSCGSPVVSAHVHRPSRLFPGLLTLRPLEVGHADVRSAVQAQAERLEDEIRKDPACWSAWSMRSRWRRTLTHNEQTVDQLASSGFGEAFGRES